MPTPAYYYPDGSDILLIRRNSYLLCGLLTILDDKQEVTNCTERIVAGR